MVRSGTWLLALRAVIFQQGDSRGLDWIGAYVGLMMLLLLLVGCKQIVHELGVIRLAGWCCSTVGQNITTCIASRRILMLLLLLLGLAIKGSVL